jgi:hypothetical protein
MLPSAIGGSDDPMGKYHTTRRPKRGARKHYLAGWISGARSTPRADRAPRKKLEGGGPSGQVPGVDVPLRGAGRLLVEHARPSANVIDRRGAPAHRQSGGSTRNMPSASGGSLWGSTQHLHSSVFKTSPHRGAVSL